MKKAT
jgi:hypothetical protein